ncbi:hypothetical protein BGZ58_002206 [Dissophora ornata]|nr:hypothetical protein BGZ58_002206 [Dissophora ornata]
MSESDIVQPKPMFRKFCLDVLSATLLSPSVILLSLKYIQQLMINLKESNKIVNTGDGAEYRFFTGALILANKFLDDNTFTNKTWADITGMKIKDVNHLEMQFLNGIDFRLFTSSAHYTEWLANLTQFTCTYMPSQHQVAYQQQAAAAQSPISPMDHTTMPVESSGSAGTTRQHGSGSGYNHSSSTQGTGSLSLSMASISHYIDSVKQINQKTGSSSRYQRAPVSTAYSQQSQAPISSVAYSSQSQYMSSNGPHSAGSYQGPTSSYTSSPTAMPYGYQQGAPEPAQRKRSAIVAFDDFIDQAPSYDMGSQPRSTQPTVMVPTHKRSSSSMSTLMSMSASQEMMSAGPSPLLQHQRHQQRPAFSHRASSGSLSASFRGQHQRNASGSYYIDMTGYSTSSSSYGQDISSMPANTYSRPGAVHPLEKDQDYCYRPTSRAEAPYPSVPHSMHHHHHHHHHRSMSSGRSSQQGYHPSTPPQYSPNKCELSCQSMGCGPNAGARGAYEVDPRLWGPLDSLSLYAITTQAAKRVVAQGKALSASANGLHMYYPTTLA